MTKKGVLRAIAWFALAIVLLLGGALAWIVCVNNAANRNARDFCAAIQVGSAIATTEAKAKKMGIYGGPVVGIYGKPVEGTYDYFFFHFVPFDKAVCEVSVDKVGNVMAKTVEIEID